MLEVSKRTKLIPRFGILMMSSFRVGNFCLYGNVSPQEFYTGYVLDFFLNHWLLLNPVAAAC